MLGTQNNPFQRLLEEIDRLIGKKVIDEEVVVQAGYTEYQPQNGKMKIIDFMPREELDTYEQNANYIITHGGVGSIVTSLEKGKKVIAVPRLHQYGEHVNNHQVEFTKLIAQKMNNIVPVYDINELSAILDNYSDIVKDKNSGENSNNSKFNERLEHIIDKLI